jgi:hypothetical protein
MRDFERVGPRGTGLIFMVNEADSKKIRLPDREEITLCEAVTAFVFGNARNVVDQMADGDAVHEEHSARVKGLIERLHGSAYAGRIKLRALKSGDRHADGHKEIDPLYFSEPRGIRWDLDQIWSHDLSPYRPKFKSQPNFTMDWHDVHLDREKFEALLSGMGVSVQQTLNADAPAEQKTYKSGAAGRPTSIHLVLPEARSRLDVGDYPDTLAKFSEQLAEALAKSEPHAHPITAKTIRNNAEIRELWRRKPPKIIDPS